MNAETNWRANLSRKALNHLPHNDKPELVEHHTLMKTCGSDADRVHIASGASLIRLEGECRLLVRQLVNLKSVRAVTSNQYAMHEQQLDYRNIRFMKYLAELENNHARLQMWISRWHGGYAVSEQTVFGWQQSLQFFDRNGALMHKVLLTEDSDTDYFFELIDWYAAADQTPAGNTEAVQQARAEKLDNEINIISFRAGWDAMKSMQDFALLQSRHDVNRMQALRLAGDRRASLAAIGSSQEVLETLCDSAVPVTPVVANAGVTQAHTGRVNSVVSVPGSLSVKFSDAYVYLQQHAIASAWKVGIPTARGLLTALEFYSRKDELIVQFYVEPGTTKDAFAENGWKKNIKRNTAVMTPTLNDETY